MAAAGKPAPGPSIRLSSLAPHSLGAYLGTVLRDYGNKRARNKRIGPGGGTRRLHQITRHWQGAWGRNRIDGRLKVLAFAR